MKNILLPCILALGVLSTYSQTPFNKAFGTSSIGYDTQSSETACLITSDGGYIFVGSVFIGSAWSDIGVIKTDASGAIQWQKNYGTTDVEIGYTITQLNDGGYVIGGYTGPFSPPVVDALLLKINSAGTLLWAKKFGTTNNSEYTKSLQATSDGGFIATGDWNNGASGNPSTFVVKSDASGNLQWNKVYVNAYSCSSEWIESTTDGGYIVSGVTGASTQEGLLVKITSSGAVSWAKTYGGTGSPNYFYCVQQTTDGGYIAAGSEFDFGSGNGGYIVKTDASGNLSWSKYYDGNRLRFIRQTTSGGYICNNDAADASGKILSLNNVGAISWSKTYTGGIGKIYQTSDGGYIYSGVTSVFGPAVSPYDSYYIGKTDGNGVDCGERIVSITSGSASTTVNSTGLTTSSPVTFSNITLTSSSTSLSVSSKCICFADAGLDESFCACCNPGVVIGGNPCRNPSCTGLGNSISWAPSTGLSSTTICNPTATPASTTTYTLTVNYSTFCNCMNGNTQTDQVTVSVQACQTGACWPCEHPSIRMMNSDYGEETIKIFPNPSDGKITIETNKLIESIIITDVTGRVVYAAKNVASNSPIIDLAKNGKGIYFIKLIQNGIEHIEKIAVE